MIAQDFQDKLDNEDNECASPLEVKKSLSEYNKTIDALLSRDELELRVSEHMAELELLQQLNNMANSGSPLLEILNETTANVTKIFKYAACDIYLLDEGGDELVLNAISIDSKALMLAEKLTGIKALGMRVPLVEGGIFTDVVRSRELRISTDMIKVFNDFATNQFLKKLIGPVVRIFGFRAAIRAPLMAMDQVVGVMGVARKTDITETDAAVLSRFASQVALIIRKVRVEEALRKSRDELESKVMERTAEVVKMNEELNAEIAVRKRTEEQVKESLREKEVLLQEVYHRVKNNMQVISSLLSLQSRYVNDEATARQFTESQNRIRSMALIHEKLYISKDLANIDFREYVNSLVKSLRISFGGQTGRIKIIVDVNDIRLNTDTAIPCGLIINELVTNSLKYAFPEDREGQIKIKLRKKDAENIELSIADNGVGIPEGLDFQDPKTLGLELVTSLAENQLQGTFEHKAVNGTEFNVVFKELPRKKF